ncbi:MAG: hypothetical protein AB1646_02540 [Thermodesulfobacteriota bacterium]
MDVDKLWPSILPIVLIVVVSWLFSFLGSKYKKKDQDARPDAARAQAKPDEDLLEKKILEFFGVAEEVEKARQAEQTPGQPMSDIPPTRFGAPRTPQGPVTTPKPIEPKWWGA